MAITRIRIATRESALALWQAHHIRQQLEHRFPHLQVELVGMTTRGDKILDAPLAKIGGKGLFVKELEVAMLEGRADIAVHSMKDVPMAFPDGLGLAAICEREDPRDAVVSHQVASLAELPQGACVGTSSLRRQCQLQAWRPDLRIASLRGNVNTRLAKLDAGEFDAIILAAAGLRRLGMADRIRQSLDAEHSLPAPGQGAIGIECRMADHELRAMLDTLNHADTASCVLAERAMNQRLNGGCQVPIAGYAQLSGDTLHLRGLVGSVCGTRILRADASAARDHAEALGRQVADSLLAAGAAAILAEVYGDGPREH